MSGETTYLLAIALGPVQDFIAASRKARDLWQGSQMLSELSTTAAESLESDPDTELIFPTTTSLGQKHAVANKLLVSTTGNPPALANAARAAVQKNLMDMWDDLKPIIDTLPKDTVDPPDPQGRRVAIRQVADFIEWYAAWVPYDPGIDEIEDPLSYRKARKRVELLLAGRKALREFTPAAGVDMRPKSSLDPSRESIVDFDRNANPQAVRTLRLKGAEQLDAISLIKRLTGKNRFVSTSRVAIDPFIRAMEKLDPSRLATLKTHAKALRDTDLVEGFNPGEGSGLTRYAAFPFDSQLLYESSAESARKTLEKEPGAPPTTMQQDAVKNIFALIRGFTDEHREWRELPAYYAVLRADGDRMGRAIGALPTKKDHQDLSIELGKFAEEAGNIVREHFGAMIYSGGDDVLAFLPLDTALPCADTLRRKFSEIIREALAKHPKVEQPTLSVGVAIGHYAEHLQTMLKRSADAEKAAKGPRNALAVTFQAHSGGGDPRIVVHSWDDDPVRKFWATAIEFHRHETLPDGAAYELDALRREFRDAHKDGVFAADAARGLTADQVAGELLVKETVRILKRKRVKGGAAKVQKEIIDALALRLAPQPAVPVPDPDTAETPPNIPPEIDRALDVLGKFVDEVIVARRIARLLGNQTSEAVSLWNKQSEALRPVAMQSGDVAGTEEQP
ncbi:MAG: type III-B CRISPR-associated protein Cas10/Cmr2 [Thermomicrobiales bacterium]